MKYLLFAGHNYYAVGGAEDLKGVYDSLEEAVNNHDPQEFTYEGGWAHVLELSENQRKGEWADEDKWKDE